MSPIYVALHLQTTFYAIGELDVTQMRVIAWKLINIAGKEILGNYRIALPCLIKPLSETMS